MATDSKTQTASATSDLTSRQLLTVLEVAHLLRLRPKGVYAMAERGALPSIKVGGRLRFDRDELAAWLASNRRGR